MRNPIVLCTLMLVALSNSTFAASAHEKAKDRVYKKYEIVIFGPSYTTTGSLKTAADVYCGDYKSLAELGTKNVEWLGDAVKEAHEKGVKPNETIYVDYITWFRRDGFVGEPKFQMYLAVRKKPTRSIVRPPKEVEGLTRPELVKYVEGLTRKGILDSLPHVDHDTLKEAVMHVDNDTLIEVLENVDKDTLKEALVRCLDKEKLKYGLINIDGPTLEVACRVMDDDTYSLGFKIVDDATRKYMKEFRAKAIKEGKLEK